MDALRAFFDGYKTYILGSIGVVATGLFYQGYITETSYSAIMGLLGSGAAMTIRAAVSKAAK